MDLLLSVIHGQKNRVRETRQLAAYGQIVLGLARKHGGRGWLAYNAQFRQQLAAGAGMAWNDLNPSLAAATAMLDDRAGSGCCSLCLGSDHSKETCALSALEQPTTQMAASLQSLSGLPASRHAARYKPYRTGEEPICRRFNRGRCTSTGCKYEHRCSICLQLSHRAHEGSQRARAGHPL